MILENFEVSFTLKKLSFIEESLVILEDGNYLRVHFSTREILFFMTTVPAKVSIASLSMKFRLLVTLTFNCRFVCTNGLPPPSECPPE